MSSDFAPVGLPLVLIGIVYMALWGRKMLPAEPTAERAEVVRQAKSDLLLMYQLGERLFRAWIPAGSILINRLLADKHPA